MKVKGDHHVELELAPGDVVPGIGARIKLSGTVDGVWSEDSAPTGFALKGSVRKVRVAVDRVEDDS
jgi:hypothetical protein